MRRHALCAWLVAGSELWHASAVARTDEPAATPETPAVAAAVPEAAPAAAPSAEAPRAAAPEAAADSFTTSEPAESEMLNAEDAPKLDLYGFADVSYFHILTERKNNLRQLEAPYPTFFVGHFNLYLASQLGRNWRSLAEVRFIYTPTGDEDKAAPGGTFPTTDTSATDYAELQRTFSWGGVEVQRVWLEYQPFDFLNIRAGQWFTPYGYWNEDHGSPTIIAVHKPFPIGDAFFPERQTGIEAHGKYFLDSVALGYALTLSNGRGPYDAFRDLDNNKAVGGRIYVETNALGELDVGVAAYRGRFTTSTKKYAVDSSSGSPRAVIYRHVDAAYDELSLGAEARWLWKGLHVQAEFMMNDAAYDERHRPRTTGFDPRPTFAADYRRLGGYLLVGYRTPWLTLMPYAIVEHSSYTNTDFSPPVTAWTAGVNLRPTPNVVLKAEVAAALLDGLGSTGIGTQDLAYFGSQAAWAF
jgi:hypothetical protein